MSNPIGEAFESAKREFRNELDDEKLYHDMLQTTSIGQVYEATNKLQAEQLKTGGLRHLAKIGPYLTRIADYSKAVETFVQVKPDILALIWGPIVLLLQWASALKTSFDAIVNTTEDIGLALPEFDQMAKLFPDNKQIQDVLLLFFKDILEFYRLAFRFFRLSTLKISFEALWPKRRDKFKHLASIIERHKLMMRDRVWLEDISQAHEARRLALEDHDARKSEARRKEYDTIMTRIAPHRYHTKLAAVRSQVCEGSGDWLLKDDIFTAWMDPDEKSSRLLWLQGIPGAGKTALSSVVVDKTRRIGRVAYAFLSYTASDATSALSIMHSLISQLIADDGDMQTILCESISQSFEDSRSAALEIWNALLQSYAAPVYIIVDGLDEIHEDDRGDFVESIQNSLKECQNLMVCLSSRPESDLHDLLAQDASTVRVNERNSESIAIFVNHWISKWFRRNRVYEETKSRIRKWLAPLASKANGGYCNHESIATWADFEAGMFLYARVVLESIEYPNNEAEIGKELEVLPKDLDAAYDFQFRFWELISANNQFSYARILQRIDDLPFSSREKARNVLGWVSCSPVPMTVQEIQQALSIGLADRQGPTKFLGALPIQRLCGPIVEVADEYVQFVHFTVQEYITAPGVPGTIGFQESTLSLALKCVAYLRQQHHDLELLDHTLSEGVLSGIYVLHDFATSNWLSLLEQYVRHGSGDSVLPDNLIDLLEGFVSARANVHYEGKADDAKKLDLGKLKDKMPELYSTLSKAAHFRHSCSSTQNRVQKGATWTKGDPLTLSETSVLIREVIDSLISKCFVESGDHTQDCACSRVRRHHGNRPFKCRFTHCHLRRKGFANQSERITHERNHDRPWKCSVPSCEYADGDFLSRKMRDDHLDRYHQTEDRANDLADVKLDKANLEMLWIDLIKSNNTGTAEAMKNTLNTLDHDVQRSLVTLTATIGTPKFMDIVQVIPRIWVSRHICYSPEYIMLEAAAKNRNVENFKILLANAVQVQRDKPDSDITSRMAYAMNEVIGSESSAIYEAFEAAVSSQIEIMKSAKGPSNSNVAYYFTHGIGLRSSLGNLRRQNLILRLWRSMDVARSLSRTELGAALSGVATSCQSILLAEYLLQAGASVDYQKSKTSLTPLHHAVQRPSSMDAANFVRFLLLQGANPAIKAGRAKLEVKDENGAKGIFKWLGISWDELVEECKTAREKK
ncbi:hypothetical protein G7054_g3005 [Neopestalotiopsis clavispora]|nr:hypothetical protein G7054_g3005 [Neopestalotiopsis clavispora]